MFKKSIPKGKAFVITTLVLIEIGALFLMNKSAMNKPIVLDEVSLKQIEKPERFFAILLQSGSTYVVANEFPTSGYIFDTTKSGCIDENGEKLLINGQNVLTYNDSTHVAELNTSNSSYCYLYFNQEVSPSPVTTPTPGLGGLSSSLVEGLYRYQGTSVDNYICFGTTSKSDCTENPGTYMYRIIGIDNNDRMKLIKREALSRLAWNTTNNDTNWVNSSIKSALNGSSFLTNTTYVPSGWESRIDTNLWHYGDISDADITAASMATTENGFPTSSSKIGLLYLHDYEYSLAGGNNCYSQQSTCATSWIYLWQASNDSTPSDSEMEWTITREGLVSENYYAWILYEAGRIATEIVTATHAVRPVFFLTDSQEIASGTGTSSDPYILAS